MLLPASRINDLKARVKAEYTKYSLNTINLYKIIKASAGQVIITDA